MTPNPATCVPRRAVIEELSRRRGDWLAFARGLLPRGRSAGPDPEEVIQDAFARACRPAGAPDEVIANPAAWFRTIVARCAVDARRRLLGRKRGGSVVRLDQGAPDGEEVEWQFVDARSPPAHEILEREDLSRSFLRAAKGLAPRQRRLFFLVYGAGLPMDEAARELGLTARAAHAVLFRARARLRRSFRRYSR